MAWSQMIIAGLVVLCAIWGVVLCAAQNSHDITITNRKLARQSGHGVRGAYAPVNCVKVPCLALTFDDGPSAVVTPQVLDTLQRHKVRATFFVVGSHVPNNEAIVRRMHKEGHEIGNHTWSHADLTTLAPAQIQEQISATQEAVDKAGAPIPHLFRPPYGALNSVVYGNVHLTVVRWNVDPKDWETENSADIVSGVESTSRPGGVVEMHDIHQRTADSLDQIINDLKPHYNFVTVSEMLNLPPGQRGEFFGR